MSGPPPLRETVAALISSDSVGKECIMGYFPSVLLLLLWGPHRVHERSAFSCPFFTPEYISYSSIQGEMKTLASCPPLYRMMICLVPAILPWWMITVWVPWWTLGCEASAVCIYCGYPLVMTATWLQMMDICPLGPSSGTSWLPLHDPRRPLCLLVSGGQHSLTHPEPTCPRSETSHWSMLSLVGCRIYGHSQVLLVSLWTMQSNNDASRPTPTWEQIRGWQGIIPKVTLEDRLAFPTGLPWLHSGQSQTSMSNQGT